MDPLSSEEIRGNWAAVLLPINADEGIDYARLAGELDALVAARVDGIYTNGTAGEFYNQTEDEFDRVSMLVADRCEGAGVPFQIGVSHMSPRLSLERLRRAVALRPGAVQVILPDWFPVSDDEAVAFLERMAEAADPIGLVLYNPPHAKRVLRPAEIGRLKAAVPALVGVKVADGDEAWYAAMRAHAAGVAVFVPGHRLATGRRLGAHGSYSNVACLHPAGAQRWYDLMGTDIEAALEIEIRLRAFMDQHVLPFITEQGYSNQAVDKLLAHIGGWGDIGTRLRWPYRWIAESEAGRLRGIVRRAVPEILDAP